jgi:hypothetical protein
MTTEHFFYIPTIFLFGFITGKLSSGPNEFKAKSSSSMESQSTKRIIRGSLVIGSFIVFIAVFIATHVFEIPASTKAVTKSLGGLEMFDRKPSFSATEVYSRISEFPKTGIHLYKRFTHTVDILFPLALFSFLFVLGRFAMQGFLNHRTLARLLHILPIIWFGSDLLENSIVYYLLDEFPSRHNFLANGLAYVSLTKFAFLLLSVLAPIIVTVFRRQLIRASIASPATHYKEHKGV